MTPGFFHLGQQIYLFPRLQQDCTGLLWLNIESVLTHTTSETIFNKDGPSSGVWDLLVQKDDGFLVVSIEMPSWVGRREMGNIGKVNQLWEYEIIGVWLLHVACFRLDLKQKKLS